MFLWENGRRTRAPASFGAERDCCWEACWPWPSAACSCWGCAAAVSGGLAGEELGYQFTIVGCVLGGFCGGLLAVRQCGGGLLAGLGAGTVLFLLLLTVGALCFESMSLQAGGIGLLCGCLCGGAAAGLFSGRGKKRPTRKKRRK